MKLTVIAIVIAYTHAAALTDSDKRAVSVCLATQVADNTSKITKFKDMYASKTVMDAEVKAMKDSLDQQLRSMKAAYDKTKSDLDALLAGKADKTDIPTEDDFSSGGSTYVAWGFQKCPTQKGTSTVYTGWAGGGYYQHNGSGSQYICMADVPEWGSYNNGNQDAALLYQVEYETAGYGVDNNYKGVNNREVPCAVCQVDKRAHMIMIPGRQVCYSGWTTEYLGMMMSAHHSHNHPTSWVCVNKTPQNTVIHSNGNQNGSLMYPVEMECNSAPSQVSCNACPSNRFPKDGPCDRYVNNREMACAVCTK